MYSENDRYELLNQIEAFVRNNQEFACILQIGSGADGFTDIYSDIDLMAGCVDASSVEAANCKLSDFFNSIGAIYLDHRKWATFALGISAYFKNGLSVDISFMPASDMPILSTHWRLLWAQDHEIEDFLLKKSTELTESTGLVNEKYHHSFFFTLRKAEIAILRKNYIYADIAIHEARQKLLLVEAMIEGKKTHQFKAFHTLDQDFLHTLQGTYPKERNYAELSKAKDLLLSMYVRMIENHDLYQIDTSQFMIINCFE